MQYLINTHKNKALKRDTELENILSSSDALSFHQSLDGYKPTPLLSLPALAEDTGIGEIWLKDESHRFGLNAFKGLGASFAVHKYLLENPGTHTFCTATDGNHGRAVAWAARQFQQKAVIYVPSFTVKDRIDNIKNQGAEVVVIEDDYDATVQAANDTSVANNWVMLQDTGWEGYTKIPSWIMAGYLTQFEEIAVQTNHQPYFDFVFLHAGVGSWASAGLWYFNNKFGNLAPKSIIVEPEASDGVFNSMLQEKISLPRTPSHTIMAGLHCGVPSTLAMPLFQELADCFITIPDSLAKSSMRKLYFPKENDPQIITGETGAAGLSGLFQVMNNPAFAKLKKDLGINHTSKILVVSTEGATDKENFERIISETTQCKSLKVSLLR